jgi:hypothetical protein
MFASGAILLSSFRSAAILAACFGSAATLAACFGSAAILAALPPMRAGSPRSKAKKKGAPMDRGALVGFALVSLEQELQSELDLA